MSKAPSFEASFDAEGIERCCRRRGDGNGEGVYPPKPTRVSGGASLVPPVASGSEPRPKLNLVKSECSRSHLVAHI